MTIRHLKVFIKVCECNFSISRASEELCVAQPSVSQTIKELENYYGVILFDRVNRKLVLTKEGELLLAKAKEINNGFNEFEILASKKDLNPIIKIGATMTFGEFIIPKFAKVLKEKYPNLQPQFYIDKSFGLEEKILTGDLDFAFEEGLIKEKNIHSYCIGNDELVAICALDYQAPNKLKLEELINYPLLVREEGNPSRRIVDYQLAIKGYKIKNPLLVSVSNNCILSSTINGLGIGIVPAAIARRLLLENQIRKIELDVPLERKLFLINHKNKVMNQSVKRAHQLAKEILEIVKKEREKN